MKPYLFQDKLTSMDTGSHFKGKGVLEHLKEARKKGFLAVRENHGIETAGHIISGADGAKETAIFSLIIWIVGLFLPLPHSQLFTFVGFSIFGLLVWKTGRSAILAWARIERVNKLIEDEKYEIEHNRQEEKDELTEMYQAKGFSGPLLTKVIDVLMADDNKLLGVMLDEELGVSLESYEHPLKQALGAFVGVFLAGCIAMIGLTSSEKYGLFFSSYITIALSAYVMAKVEQIKPMNAIIWNLSITFLVSFGTLFLVKFLLGGT